MASTQPTETCREFVGMPNTTVQQVQPCVGCSVGTPAVTEFTSRRSAAVDPRLPVGYFKSGGHRLIGGQKMGENFKMGGFCDECAGKIREFIRMMVSG